MLARRPHRRAPRSRRRGAASIPPTAASTASSADSRCATSSSSPPCSARSRASCARVVASSPSTRRCPRTRCLRAGNTIWFRGAVPLLGRAARPRRRRVLVPAEVHRVPPVAVGARRCARRSRVHRRAALTRSPADPSSCSRRHAHDHHAGARAPPRGDPRARPGRRSARPRSTPTGFAWLHHQTRIVASGVVARLAPDDVAAALAAIEADDPLGVPGTGALAVGALPFDPAVRRRARRAGAGRRRARRPGVGHRDRARSTADAVEPRSQPTPVLRRRAADARAVARDGRGRARRDRRAASSRRSCSRARSSSRPTHRSTSPRHRRAGSCRSSRVASSTRPTGSSARAPSCSCAGSATTSSRCPSREPRSPTATTASLRALAASVKDHREHRFVVDAIVDALAECCDDARRRLGDPRWRCSVTSPTSRTRVQRTAARACPERARPRTAAAPEPGGRRHAARRRGRRDPRRSRASTAAATPDRSAGSTRAETASGRSRCAAPSSTARDRALVAGAGIVEGSEPDAEWAETQAKLEPMLRAPRRRRLVLTHAASPCSRDTLAPLARTCYVSLTARRDTRLAGVRSAAPTLAALASDAVPRCAARRHCAHRRDDAERLGARDDRPGERHVGRIVRQVLLAAEEPHERPPLFGGLVADRPAEHRVLRLERVEHRALRDRRVHLQCHLAGHLGERLQMRGQHDPDHGNVCTSTDSTAGRSRTIGSTCRRRRTTRTPARRWCRSTRRTGRVASTAIASRNTFT